MHFLQFLIINDFSLNCSQADIKFPPSFPCTDYAHAHHQLNLHLHSQFPRGMRGQSSEMHKQCRSSVFGPLELTSSSLSLSALSADFPCRIHSHSFKVRQLSILKTRHTVEARRGKARRAELSLQFSLSWDSVGAGAELPFYAGCVF